MSIALQMSLMVFAAWLVVTTGAFLIIRWLLVNQRSERRDLIDRLQEMIGTIHTYQVAAHEQPPPPGQGRQHYTEEEEDVLAKTDELRREELQAALAEAEFMGTEVEVEPS